MIYTLIACAALCAFVLAFVLQPVRNKKTYYTASFGCAVMTIAVYLLLGAPGLPASPVTTPGENAQLMQTEFRLMDALSKNPDDTGALIKLAALRVLQGRINDETIRLLNRADALKPGDHSIKFIRSVIEHPDPATATAP
jgi:hypothetical protein